MKTDISLTLSKLSCIYEIHHPKKQTDTGCPADFNVNFQHGKSNSSVEFCAISLSSFSLAIYVARLVALGCLFIPTTAALLELARACKTS